MAAKKTFANPDSSEREYTRLMLSYSRGLATDSNLLLVPAVGIIKREFDAEVRGDAWTDTLAAIMAELARMATVRALRLIEKLRPLFLRTSSFNERQFRLIVKANTGLKLPEVTPTAPMSSLLGINVFRTEPYLVPLADGWIKTNTDLIKSLPTRLHPELEGIIRRGVTNGVSVREIQDQIKERYPVTDSRAKLIAQDQTLKLNADLTRYRLQSVGVKKYIWRTVNDSRVRPEHVERNGKEYAFDKPPSGGLNPGQEVRCRCRAEAIWEEVD